MNEELETAQKNMGEIHKLSAEGKKSHTKEQIAYDSIYVHYKSNQNKSRLFDVRMVLTLWWVDAIREHDRRFWSNIQFIELCAGYTGIFSL